MIDAITIILCAYLSAVAIGFLLEFLDQSKEADRLNRKRFCALYGHTWTVDTKTHPETAHLWVRDVCVRCSASRGETDTGIISPYL